MAVNADQVAQDDLLAEAQMAAGAYNAMLPLPLQRPIHCQF
jgi:hypothetical protein